MPINKNHEFEELGTVKCAIVEKNVDPERVQFLKSLLELNGFIVVVVPSLAPKPAIAPPVPGIETDANQQPATNNQQPATSNLQPTTFTVGVTDVTFNPINAIFGRLLHSSDGRVVTLAYWQQKESASQDDIPYFNKKQNFH